MTYKNLMAVDWWTMVYVNSKFGSKSQKGPFSIVS